MRYWAVGQGIRFWRNNTLKWAFTHPGSHLIELRAPQVLPKTSTGCCWGLLWGNIQNPNHQPNRWASFTPSTPMFLTIPQSSYLRSTLKTMSPGQPTIPMAPFFSQVTTLKFANHRKAPRNYMGNPFLANNVEIQSPASGRLYIMAASRLMLVQVCGP